MFQAFHQELVSYLKSNTVENLLAKRKSFNLLHFSPNDSIEQTIEKFAQCSVRSAPVTSSLSVSDLVFVDFIDTVSYMVDLLSQAASNNQPLDSQQLFETFAKVPVSHVANYTKGDLYAVLPLKNTTLYEAAEKLSAKHHCNRVVFADEHGKILNVLTHSDMISVLKDFIDHHAASQTQIAQLLHTITAENLQLGHFMPKCISEDQPAFEAFKIMRNHKQSFVPVVSADHQELISVVSARDLKVLFAQPVVEQIGRNFKALGLPVIDFVGLTRQSTTEDKYPYIWCKKDSTFEIIVKRLRATHVHRLMVINDYKQVEGVITVQQVLSNALV